MSMKPTPGQEIDDLRARMEWLRTVVLPAAERAGAQKELRELAEMDDQFNPRQRAWLSRRAEAN